MSLYVVTGVTGFLGSRLARQLLAAGHQVIGLKRASSSLQQVDFCGITQKVEFHESENLSLAGILKDRQAEVIFHTASLSRSGESASELAVLVDTNIKWPLLLVQEAKQLKIKTFVNASTSWQSVTGLSYSPFNIYAGTKEAFENMLTACANNEIACVSLRLFDTYGVGDTRRKIVDLIIDAVLSGDELKMSPGEQKINLVNIEDIARAFIVASQLAVDEVNAGHRVYNLPAVQPIGLKEVARIIGLLAGKEPKILWGGRPYRPNEVMFPHASHPTLPGWSPQVVLDKGLKEIIEYRKQSGI
jgi:nucleoside-diphosphate-sugar epimerase